MTKLMEVLEQSRFISLIEPLTHLKIFRLTPEEMCKLLTKMSLKSTINKNDSDRLNVTIPPTRQDILHACDILEDVGVAYGYNNIAKTFPRTVTVGKQLPINKITDQLRFELARCGFTEALTFSLVKLGTLKL